MVSVEELTELYCYDEDKLVFNEFVGIIRKISEKAKEGLNFESYALKLLVHRLNGHGSAEFARKLGLSEVAIHKWTQKLRKLLIVYLNGEGIDPECYMEDISGVDITSSTANSVVL